MHIFTTEIFTTINLAVIGYIYITAKLIRTMKTPEKIPRYTAWC